MASNGIDVSSYQTGLGLKTITGLDFVIAKCTEGTTIADPSYANFRAQAEALKVPFGAYHFLHAETQSGLQEANWFLSHAGDLSSITLWIDYEVYGATVDNDIETLTAFTERLKREIPAVGLYVNLTGLGRVLKRPDEYAYDALWLAAPSIPMGQQSSPAWDIHQYETFQNIDRDYSADITAVWKKLGR